MAPITSVSSGVQMTLLFWQNLKKYFGVPKLVFDNEMLILFKWSLLKEVFTPTGNTLYSFTETYHSDFWKNCSILFSKTVLGDPSTYTFFISANNHRSFLYQKEHFVGVLFEKKSLFLMILILISTKLYRSNEICMNFTIFQWMLKNWLLF